MIKDGSTYGENLRFCCDHYKSISVVCRKLGFNRQQFNKYINGQSQPSRHNHKRLSDFFGLNYHELHMPHEDFVASFGQKSRSVPTEIDAQVVRQITDLLVADNSETSTYAGYYFRYAHSKTDPSRLKRDLCHFYMQNGILYTSIRCKLFADRAGTRSTKSWTYRGAVALLSGRLFWMEFDRELDSEITLSILIPSTTRIITQLEGLVLGTGLDRSRRIVAGRLVLEYLGRSIDARSALRAVGLFEKDDPTIPDTIRTLIRAEIPAHEAVIQLK